MTTRAEAIRGGNMRMLLLILAIGVQVALLGAYLGARTAFGGDPPVGALAEQDAATLSAGYGIASDVRTSFGSVVVGTAQALKGVTSRALGGNNHNIGGYVPPEKVQVQVTVEITNRLRTQIPYSPSQFSLIAGTSKPVAVTGSSIKPGRLLPDAAIEATLIFVVPRKAQKLKLAFQDSGRTMPFLIDLGRVNTAPQRKSAHNTHP